jgi:hypothetical protein
VGVEPTLRFRASFAGPLELFCDTLLIALLAAVWMRIEPALVSTIVSDGPRKLPGNPLGWTVTPRFVAARLIFVLQREKRVRNKKCRVVVCPLVCPRHA